MAQKVYLVKAGEYSDYYIERVFLDKEKAERYAQLRRYTSDINGVEEYELSDDMVMMSRYFVEFIYYIPGMEKLYQKSPYTIDQPYLMSGKYYLNIRECLESDINSVRRTDYNNGIIKLIRPIRHGVDVLDTEKLAQKYLKVCEDLSAKIRYEFLSGASEYHLRSMFRNYDEEV